MAISLSERSRIAPVFVIMIAQSESEGFISASAHQRISAICQSLFTQKVS